MGGNVFKSHFHYIGQTIASCPHKKTDHEIVIVIRVLYTG